jgi:hypothetical protein
MESTTLPDLVRNVFRKHFLETELGYGDVNARIFEDYLYRRAFRYPVERIAEGAGERDFLPEADSPYRSPLQEKVREAVASTTHWWWDNLNEMRSDAAGRAVADLIELRLEYDAIEAAKRGPQPRRPPEIEAAFEAERRYEEGKRRW